uniref:Uncharacterized protein n=1 Tax=Eptatretus burgeri TaxID=7764 RepID=A0A8C4Q6H9_EPTBU
MNCFVGDFYLPLVLVFTFQPTEMLGQDHCVCTEKSPPPSIDLSVSQQTTTNTTNVNGRAEFHCNVSIMNRSTDHPWCTVPCLHFFTTEDATSKTPTTTRDDPTAAATTEITKGSGKYIIAICIGVPILVLMIAATVLVFARMQRNKRPSQQFNGEPGNGTLEGENVYIPPRNGEQLANKKEGRTDGIYSVVTYEPKNKRNS